MAEAAADFDHYEVRVAHVLLCVRVRLTVHALVWQATEVREWLEELIEQVIEETELEPPPPSYAPYELQRQRNIVSNNRVLLALAQAALRDAPAGASSARVAFLESDRHKAEACLQESSRVLLAIEQHVRD